MNLRDAFLIGDVPTLLKQVEQASEARFQARLGQAQEVVQGVAADLRDDVTHHEACLDSALDDIFALREPARPNPCFDRELALQWSVTSANKHEAALSRIRGYSMPDDLRRKFDRAMGDE